MTTSMGGDVTVDLRPDFVAVVEVHRPPNNHFDLAMITALAESYEMLEDDPGCRAIVLASEGKHFCAGADFGGSSTDPRGSVYDSAHRLFGTSKPIVAAVQGAAVGGGLGLACSTDFRVTCPEARFVANFARLGFHHGFGLTVTLPPLVGSQRALEMLYIGRRIGGEEAFAIGLADRLVPVDAVRDTAIELAADIARSAPIAVSAIRRTMRGHLQEAIKQATAVEGAAQDRMRVTEDFAEGVSAYAERREPNFRGR
jgi:enoyl-CoA hydratase/carnithine racemase